MCITCSLSTKHKLHIPKNDRVCLILLMMNSMYHSKMYFICKREPKSSHSHYCNLHWNMVTMHECNRSFREVNIKVHLSSLRQALCVFWMGRVSGSTNPTHPKHESLAQAEMYLHVFIPSHIDFFYIFYWKQAELVSLYEGADNLWMEICIKNTCPNLLM